MDEIKTYVIASVAYIIIIILTGIIGNHFWLDEPKIEYVYESYPVYVYTTDTVDNTNYNLIDSLKSELLIKELKLERIKEYNRIAAKDNNIKYLRGWINRVLEE